MAQSNIGDDNVEKDKDALDFYDVEVSVSDEDDDDEEEDENENDDDDNDLKNLFSEENKKNEENQSKKERKQTLKSQKLREEIELRGTESEKSSRFKNLDLTFEVLSKKITKNDVKKYNRVVSGINSEGNPILKFTEIFFGQKKHKYPTIPKPRKKKNLFFLHKLDTKYFGLIISIKKKKTNSISHSLLISFYLAPFFPTKKPKAKKQMAEEKLFFSTVNFGESKEEAEKRETSIFEENYEEKELKIFEINKDFVSKLPEIGYKLKTVEGQKEDEMMDEEDEEELTENVQEFLSKNETQMGCIDFNLWEMNINWGESSPKENMGMSSVSTPQLLGFSPQIENKLVFSTPMDRNVSKEEGHFGRMVSSNYQTEENRPSLNEKSTMPLQKKNSILNKKKAENEDLNNGDWLNSVIWEETVRPSLPVNTKLILDLNDSQMNLLQYQKEKQDVDSKKRLLEERAKIREIEDIDRLLEEEVEANAPAETKKKRGRPPTKKDPETIKADKNLIQNSKLESKKVELFEKRKRLKIKYAPSDPYNISQDNEYSAKYILDENNVENPKLKKIFLQHSLPTQNIEVFKTHYSQKELDNFHKPKFDIEPGDKFSLCWNQPPPISNDENFYVLNKIKDLSGCQNDVVLAEYLEEFPIITNNVGMEMRLQTFYRKKNENDNIEVESIENAGELVCLSPNEESPFYGQIPHGSHVTAFNCNIFRAPTGLHSTRPEDFLLVFQKEKIDPSQIQASNSLLKVAAIKKIDKVN